MNKPEVIAGIAVLESLSADASLAMDGWIRRRPTTPSQSARSPH